MRKIVYYVAISLDGFISGPDGDISGFLQSGNGVEKYQQDLAEFDTVIMGRNTYEFGYQYGLKPGKRAYPHMRHYIFSKSLKFEIEKPEVEVCALDLEIVQQLKAEEGIDIYLCGGGIFAGWLLKNGLIDIVKIKLNPFVQGEGVRLFEGLQKQYQLSLVESNLYEEGLQIMTYQVNY
ncbi:MAG: dihydrofolate reductase family protein [Bacteroidia bacterium]